MPETKDRLSFSVEIKDFASFANSASVMQDKPVGSELTPADVCAVVVDRSEVPGLRILDIRAGKAADAKLWNVEVDFAITDETAFNDEVFSRIVQAWGSCEWARRKGLKDLVFEALCGSNSNACPSDIGFAYA